MEIEKIYSKARFLEVKDRYEEWWEHKNSRPVAGVAVKCREPDLPKPKYPLLSQATCNDFSISEDDILDAVEYEACSYEYYGDAYPMFSLDCFGPGIVAAILGAELDNSTGNVWFHAKEILEPEDLHIYFDENNPWFVRLKKIMEKSVERFEGKILLSMPDLSGILDILAVFRPGEKLLLDLYDEPEEVQRLAGEVYDAWINIYRKFAAFLNMDEFGYTDWSTLLSRKPSYFIQEDFCYMIGPDMFEEFVYPNLERFCGDIERTIYHLDGPGEVRHLSKILTLDKLRAVQWIPGEGNPSLEHYREMYQSVERAGKYVQLPMYTPEKDLQTVGFFENPACTHTMMIRCTEREKGKYLNYLKKLGVI